MSFPAMDGPRRAHRGGDRASRYSRQMSLQIGQTAPAMESGHSDSMDNRYFKRSGKSVKGDFSMFRTRSSLSKQNSMMPIRKDGEIERRGTGEEGGGEGGEENPVMASVPAGRYFAALRGPELDQVRESEDILLPKDEVWPFLLRFPINSYGMCLGLGSQSVLWSSISSSTIIPDSIRTISHIPHTIIWLIALTSLLSISTLYLLKFAFFFEAVRREYYHPVRVNFFFAPFIASLFLSLSLPSPLFPEHHRHAHPSLFLSFIIPILSLELKIYGQWLSGGMRRLAKVANPTTHLSIVGNFVGAIFAARIQWYEPAKFLWAVGFAHYLVVFVTLYQRLPTNETLPKELHPVYSMFIAAPSSASIAWGGIHGYFDDVARTCYFIALFLFMSLVVRINFFRGFQFSVAWWAYTFPMTTLSVATMKYAEAAPSRLTRGMALALGGASTAVVGTLLALTVLHGMYWRSLFPNDLAIAITNEKVGSKRGKSSENSNSLALLTAAVRMGVESLEKKSGGVVDG